MTSSDVPSATERRLSARPEARNVLAAVLGSTPAVVMTSGETVSERPDELAWGLPVVTVAAGSLLRGGDELESELDRVLSTHRGAAIVLVFPFGRLEGSGVRREGSEVAAANLALSPFSSELVLILHVGALAVRARAFPFVQQLVGWHPALVIELDGAALFEGVHPSFRLCVLQLVRTAPATTRFVDVPSRQTVDLASELRQLNNSARSQHGFALSGPLDWSAGLLPGLVDPVREQRTRQLAAVGALQRLGDTCEVLTGITAAAMRPATEPGPETIPVLAARQIRGQGLALDEVTQWVERSKRSTELRGGDLVMRSLWVRGDRPSPVAEVHDDDLPLVAGAHVIVVRPHGVVDRVDRLLLRHFLNSDRFRIQLDSVVSGSMHLRGTEIADTRMPVADDDLRAAFGAVEDARDEFNLWRAEANGLLGSLFDNEDLHRARRDLLRNSTLLRHRAAAGRQLDDLSYRVSVRFPLPVAYRWRSALAARGGPDELRAVLHAEEVLLAYLAVTATLLARQAGLQLRHLSALSKRLAAMRAGTGLGDWRAILQEVAERRDFDALPDAHPFIEVCGFLGDAGTTAAVDSLSDLRNDLSHLREFGPGELSQVTLAAWSALERTFAAAEFITDYPLLRVLTTRWDGFTETNHLSVRNLAGDHAVVPREELSVSTSDIEADSLYLRDRRGRLHLLRPLVVGEECPMCGHWSTFMPDKLTRHGVQYKSLEHGHTTTRQHDGELRQVGFLPD